MSSLYTLQVDQTYVCTGITTRMIASVSVFFFLCIGFSSSAPSSKPTLVQDWYTLNSTVQIGIKPSINYVGEFGYLKHVMSGKYILPDGGLCPNDENLLRIGTNSVDKPNMFRFVQVVGHLGYIEHQCGRVVHPKGGSATPWQSTRTVLHKDRHGAAYFYFDEEAEHIVHTAGRIFHPYYGNANPSTGTQIRLHSDIHGAAKFKFEPSAYPPPVLTGRWVVLFAVIDPISEHSYSIQYHIGKSITKQATEKTMWKVSAQTGFSWFKASAEFSRMACISQTNTWEVQIQSIYTVKVYPGQTSVTWQWIFGSERLDEGYQFRSTILGDTNDINKPPNIDPETYPSNC